MAEACGSTRSTRARTSTWRGVSADERPRPGPRSTSRRSTRSASSPGGVHDLKKEVAEFEAKQSVDVVARVKPGTVPSRQGHPRFTRLQKARKRRAMDQPLRSHRISLHLAWRQLGRDFRAGRIEALDGGGDARPLLP